MTRTQLIAFRNAVALEIKWISPNGGMTVDDFDALDAQIGEALDALFTAFGIDPDAPVGDWDGPTGKAVTRIYRAVSRAAKARV